MTWAAGAWGESPWGAAPEVASTPSVSATWAGSTWAEGAWGEESVAAITFLAAWARGSNHLIGQGMKKNVSGQVIGVQMVSASDGSAFTGTVSALVTKDGATQTAGSGAVTHEGNGFHTYAITQSETNADHVAVTFTGSGAIPVTVQTYTIAAIAAAVWDEAIASHVSAGTTGLALRDTDLRGSRTVIRGTVGTATTPSVTQFTTSSITPAGAVSDQFKGRIIVFDNDTTTVTLRGQATDITANSAASNPLLTFTALTTAPANGDTFSIV